MNVYSVDVKIAATAYIKASTAEEAKAIAMQQFNMVGLEVKEGGWNELPISGLRLDDPALPDVSLSPAMTIHKMWSSEPSLAQENV